jgi:pre-rRNA-processing protein TSR1
MSKLDRKNQARQKLLLKNQEKVQAGSIFLGQNGAPRHVAIIPLSAHIDTRSVIRLLNASVDVPDDISLDGTFRVRIDRFKQSLMYIPAKYELMSALDVCRLADFVVFVLPTDQEVDEDGEVLIRSIESQGVSNVLAVAQVCVELMPASPS